MWYSELVGRSWNVTHSNQLGLRVYFLPLKYIQRGLNKRATPYISLRVLAEQVWNVTHYQSPRGCAFI